MRLPASGMPLTRILLGARAERVAADLVFLGRAAAWQRLAPAHVETARILLWIQDPSAPLIAGYLTGIENFARTFGVRLRNDDVLTYGAPQFDLSACGYAPAGLEEA
jgi:hypothetical protein